MLAHCFTANRDAEIVHLNGCSKSSTGLRYFGDLDLHDACPFGQRRVRIKFQKSHSSAPTSVPNTGLQRRIQGF
jgi:hypothetical protein